MEVRGYKESVGHHQFSHVRIHVLSFQIYTESSLVIIMDKAYKKMQNEYKIRIYLP